MGIGTTHESALHRELKHLFSAYTGKTEIDVDGFVCDGSKDDGTVFEVQLGSFGPLKRKAEIICEKRRLVILHPVIHTKEIYTFDEHQNLMSRRKSPRKGSEWDVFKALIYAPRLPLIKNISIELVHVDITETRVADGTGSWRRRGRRITGRSLAAYHGVLPLERPRDYLRFVPFKKTEIWTTKDLAQRAKITGSIAQKTVYVLSRMNLVHQEGKQGRFAAWKLSPPPRPVSRRPALP